MLGLGSLLIAIATRTFVGAVPVVVAIVPDEGTTDGADHVVIEVADSTDCTSAAIDGVDLDNFAIDDATHVSGDTVAHAAGAVDVTVTNTFGTSAPLVGGFTFVADVVLTSISTDVGDPLGGATVVLTGTGFTTADDVLFGATSADSFVIDSDIQITAVSPAHAAGSMDITVTTPTSTSSGIAYEFWDLTVPGGTSFARKPNYAVAAGAGTWTATTGTSLTESAFEPAAASGAPDFNGPSDRIQYPVAAGTLFGATAAVGGTFACVIDLDGYTGVLAANCIMGNSANTFAVFIEAGLVVNFYYKSGTYKIAGPLAIPSSGRIAIVCRRNVTGSPFIEMTVDGGANWAGSVGTTAVGDLDTPAADLFLGNNGTYPLNAKFFVEYFNTDDWSDADVARFQKWQAATFP